MKMPRRKLSTTAEWSEFLLLTIGDLSDNPVFQIRVPHILSVLATNTWNGKFWESTNCKSSPSRSTAPEVTSRSVLCYCRSGSWWASGSCSSCSVARPLARAQAALERSPASCVSRRGWYWRRFSPTPSDGYSPRPDAAWVVYGLLTTSKAVTLISPDTSPPASLDSRYLLTLGSHESAHDSTRQGSPPLKRLRKLSAFLSSSIGETMLLVLHPFHPAALNSCGSS